MHFPDVTWLTATNETENDILATPYKHLYFCTSLLTTFTSLKKCQKNLTSILKTYSIISPWRPNDVQVIFSNFLHVSMCGETKKKEGKGLYSVSLLRCDSFKSIQYNPLCNCNFVCVCVWSKSWTCGQNRQMDNNNVADSLLAFTSKHLHLLRLL